MQSWPEVRVCYSPQYFIAKGIHGLTPHCFAVTTILTDPSPIWLVGRTANSICGFNAVIQLPCGKSFHILSVKGPTVAWFQKRKEGFLRCLRGNRCGKPQTGNCCSGSPPQTTLSVCSSITGKKYSFPVLLSNSSRSESYIFTILIIFDCLFYLKGIWNIFCDFLYKLTLWCNMYVENVICDSLTVCTYLPGFWEMIKFAWISMSVSYLSSCGRLKESKDLCSKIRWWPQSL